MKKEKILKEVVMRLLIGFPIGVTMLMFGYIFIYIGSGESIFQQEISQLQNIHILISQMLGLGLVYWILLIYFRMFSLLDEEEFKAVQLKRPYLTVFIVVTLMLISLFLMLTITSSNLFSKNLNIVNSVGLLVLMTLQLPVLAVKKVKENKIIERINQIIKEKN